MTTRSIKFEANSYIEPCPKCGNNREFVANSDYCAEDCCEVWIVCTCGYEPTLSDDNRLEDVWGGVSDENVRAAIECWNASIRSVLK